MTVIVESRWQTPVSLPRNRLRSTRLTRSLAHSSPPSPCSVPRLAGSAGERRPRGGRPSPANPPGQSTAAASASSAVKSLACLGRNLACPGGTGWVRPARSAPIEGLLTPRSGTVLMDGPMSGRARAADDRNRGLSGVCGSGDADRRLACGATTCGNGPLAADPQLCGPLFLCPGCITWQRCRPRVAPSTDALRAPPGCPVPMTTVGWNRGFPRTATARGPPGFFRLTLPIRAAGHREDRSVLDNCYSLK
jgi:hypothetical protein